MELSKSEKRLIRINMIKDEIIAHLEMDPDVSWNLSERELEKVRKSIQSFFEDDIPSLSYRIYLDEE